MRADELKPGDRIRLPGKWTSARVLIVDDRLIDRTGQVRLHIEAKRMIKTEHGRRRRTSQASIVLDRWVDLPSFARS